jgi:hypothetical protein
MRFLAEQEESDSERRSTILWGEIPIAEGPIATLLNSQPKGMKEWIIRKGAFEETGCEGRRECRTPVE